jgi:hypothetical protein
LIALSPISLFANLLEAGIGISINGALVLPKIGRSAFESDPKKFRELRVVA